MFLKRKEAAKNILLNAVKCFFFFGAILAAHAQIFIDSFDSGDFSFSPSGPSGSTTVSGDPFHIAGGTRSILFENDNSTQGHSSATVGGGVMQYIRKDADYQSGDLRPPPSGN